MKFSTIKPIVFGANVSICFFNKAIRCFMSLSEDKLLNPLGNKLMSTGAILKSDSLMSIDE